MIRLLMALTGLFLLALTASAPAQDAIPQYQAEINLTFAPVVKRVAPAVVNVYAAQTARNPFAGDPFYERFYGQQKSNSLGSGVIVSADGLIVTNNHVIEGADELTVVLSDRREFKAKLEAADPRTDIALLRIDAKGETLPSLSFRDSDTVEVGDLVLAVGNPFGVGQTVTQGIVSAVARTNTGISDFQSFIQTDAAINPGNSGGALVDSQGRLIGINTAIFSRSGGSVGIGFAIPANLVKATIDGARSGGRVARAWLGAETQEITAEIAMSLGLDRPQGVLVRAVSKDGPAAAAGLSAGDVIRKINGFEVNDPAGVRYRITTAGVGQTAALEGLRDKQPMSWSVALVAPPEGDRKQTTIEGRNPMSGAVVANLSPAVADELGIDDSSGVIVIGTQRRSIASGYGFRGGDIVVSINGRDLNTVDELLAALDGARGAWRMVIKRQGDLYTLEVRG